ncbi:hypothetical protein DL95DRAFT_459154 [Leptodontidium sp. 2 PMI_412]|nr:hypothetical protein DL95DRAFT_459154 [Leptodontidium sp. 2 PMI_412]
MPPPHLHLPPTYPAFPVHPFIGSFRLLAICLSLLLVCISVPVGYLDLVDSSVPLTYNHQHLHPSRTVRHIQSIPSTSLGVQQLSASINNFQSSLDNNQERLNLQYVSPWQVELKPNPINFVFDTYSLHPYTPSQLISVTEEPRASASSSEGKGTEPLPPIISNFSSTRSSSPTAALVPLQLPGQTSTIPQSPRTVIDEPNPKRQPLNTAHAPLLPPISDRSTSLRSITPTSDNSRSLISPNSQAFGTPSPASSTSQRSRQSSYGCSLCHQVFPKQHLLNRHNTAVHNKRFVCNVQGCDHQESFGLRKDLTRHRTSRHPLLYPASVYHCTFVGCPYGPGSPKSFRRKDNRDRHIREH